MKTLQATTTVELEALRGAYNAPSLTLTNFERLAILRAIESELSDRAAAVRSCFTCESEIQRLQAMLEERDSEILFLRIQLDDLEEQLEAAKKPANA
jgi:hypothetical protein